MMEIETITQMLTASTAFLAVTIGPIITLKIAKRNINAEMVTSNRQKWINDLRNELSTFLAIINMRGMSNKDGTRTEKIYYSKCKIELLLNENEEESKELIKLLDKIIDKNELSNFVYLREEIIFVSRSIIKKEWDRIKKHE